MLRTLVNLNPNGEYRALEEMIDRAFGAPFRSVPTSGVLPVDVLERNGSLVVRAAVPGINPNELDITIEKNVLTIKGEVTHQSTEENERIYRREVSHGAFARSIRLPEGLDESKFDAQFQNGIVTITLPRLPEEKPKSLKLNVRNSETNPIIPAANPEA